MGAQTASTSGTPARTSYYRWGVRRRTSQRPDLDGNQIMAVLDIPAGPQVGEAWRYLKELRLERGPLSTEEATTELLSWWKSRGNR